MAKDWKTRTTLFGLRLLLMVLFTVLAFDGFSQRDKKDKRPKAIHWSEWSDSVAFQNGPIPLVQAYGPHSDSLSQVYGGIFYILENQYFPIKTAADYYLWFTRRYDFLFRSPIEQYELLYIAGDQYLMAVFISENYKGKRYPIKMSLSLPSSWKYKDSEEREKLARQRQQKKYEKNVSDPTYSTTKKKN